jgi:predicted RNase H-like HicB family nuclease
MATQREPLSYYLALEYPYTVVPDEGAYFIRFPDLPGCMTQVDDPGSIAAMAEEIRTLWIEGEYEDGATIPEPSSSTRYSGKFVVRLPKSLHRDLVEAAEDEGTSLNAYVTYLLAERRAQARVEQPHSMKGAAVVATEVRQRNWT